ncbi:MAG: 30S ribosomal protein S17e [Nitrososphaeria archaeon]
MGQVRNLAFLLINKYGNEFSDDFEKNKQILDKYVKFNSKSLRNMVAGYITSYVNKNVKKVVEAEEEKAE